ncbi:extracellular solute-binding protein [Rossellomorea marisflavi]|uniref:Sugar ABC transporter substrate-binding protein n=2 Tax=Bacillaceae TaxID=186817 RepID=A0A0J5S718_9BACI|nr:sugar ABC transporter substrate-binding protein [Rossellomorea marisflavi]KML05584.1 sugar ABC transporter substrate-binding protein [Rossellomorea marisflavi]KZE52555.1 sugar ABC transporter substrate-binding protein [Rossellomorea marisflavi]QHA37766.1 extracellular solute-binding protein [Rossellomorea marisflavi]TYO74555.1 sugar ABC transporter substrate-binding protein [Rossellomorea marisflavi]
MKRMKKLVVLMGIIATLIIAGCSSNSSGGDGKGKDGKVTLTAWAWNVNVGALNEAIKTYEKENPDVKLKVEDIGRLDVYDKLSTGLAAGGVGLPDIVLVEDDRIHGYVEAFPDGFVNLSEKGFKDHEDKFPSFKNDLAQVDGDYYAMPFDAGPSGMFYRRSIFEEAGVKAEDIETWDDFLEAGKTIKDKTGVAAMPLDMFKDDPTFRMMLNQQGAFYFDEKGNIDLTNPKAVKAMEIQKKFADADLIKNVDGWNGTVSATADGSVATIPFGAWYYGTIVDQAKDTSGDWGVFPLPAIEEGGNRAANLGGGGWMIPASSKNADAAYKFMEFFSTDTDTQIMAMEDYGLFPSLNTAYDSEVFTEGVEFFGGQEIWSLFADEMKDIPTAYYTKDYSLALDEAIKAQADMFNGAKADKALEDAAKRLKDRTKRDINN